MRRSGTPAGLDKGGTRGQPVGKDEKGPTLTIRMERTVCDPCLPLTMALAFRHERLVHRALRKQGVAFGSKGNEWPFADRVLIWLADYFRKDITAYHGASGPAMDAIFQPHQLESLDRTFCDELRRRLGVGPQE